MRTIHINLTLFFLAAIIALSGCKSYNVDYTNPDGRQTYSLDEVKISKKEKQAWVNATTLNSVNSYKRYLSDFPNGKYADEARANLLFASKYNTQLQAMYPNDTKYANDTNNQNLSDFFTQIKKDEAKWATLNEGISNPNLSQDDLIATYQDYLKLYPNGVYAQKAKENIAFHQKEKEERLVLEEKKRKANEAKLIRKKKEEQLWNEIQASTDKEATLKKLRAYLSTYENDGAHFDEALAMYEELNSPNSATGSDSEEEELWNIILNTSNKTLQRDLLNSYLVKFPDGDHVMEATAMLAQMDADISPPTTAPPAPITEAIVAPPQSADTILIEKTLTEECANDMKLKGVVAYDELPKTMFVDSLYDLHILINDIGNVDEIKDDLKKREGVDLDTAKVNIGEKQEVGDYTVQVIEIGSWVRVTLKELKDQNAFKITNVLESPEENNRGQNIDCDKNAEWRWKIVPQKAGKRTLFLVMEMKTTEDGDYKPIDDTEKYIEKEIYVDVIGKPWYAQLWGQLLLGGGVLGLLALLFLFFRKKRKQQPDQVFGANLAAASGAVKDVATPPAKPKSVFIAYAKEDEEWARQIHNQMKVLQKGGFANIWYDQLLQAGTEYKEEIFKHLEESDIIILNISSDFLASDFCDELMQRAIDRQSEGKGVILMPIIVRPCLWATTPLASLNVFPKNKKPLSDKDEWRDTDNAIVNVMNEMESKLLN